VFLHCCDDAITEKGQKASAIKQRVNGRISLSVFSPVCENGVVGHLHLTNPILFAGSKLSRSLG
jgi:hypothetical protein